MKFVGIYCRENHNGEKSPFSFKLFDIKEIENKEIPLVLGLHATPHLWPDDEAEMPSRSQTHVQEM